MEPTQIAELKRLRQENARLKKMVAERDLEIEVMKEIAIENGKPLASNPSRAVLTHEGLGNDGQFISYAGSDWAMRRGVALAYIDPGKPWQNGSA